MTPERRAAIVDAAFQRLTFFENVDCEMLRREQLEARLRQLHEFILASENALTDQEMAETGSNEDST
eukprot:CAMPEP_0118982124 /NCGR_PEP_ID=MMETSP1173-20130426/32087_1 /TAXON_ID=1034831 /ORGANISM="Rhizochromulina marina cf, Strain CCMP1243" /LENGTH=66 /DNA_ID=CAMNT_0006932593 /DNA_START=31 /DNA_END=228 /DNA_ORIENTATION=+